MGGVEGAFRSVLDLPGDCNQLCEGVCGHPAFHERLFIWVNYILQYVAIVSISSANNEAPCHYSSM